MIRTATIVTIAMALAGCDAADPFVSARPGVAVTPQQLVTAYADNEVRAQQQYGAQLLLVSSMVDAIKLNSSDKPFLNLSWKGSLLPVQLSFEPGYEADASSIEKGKSYSFECLKVSEVLGTPMLSRCRLMR